MTSSEPDPAPAPETADLEMADAEIVESVPAEPVAADYTQGGVPTFDFVRNRIEGRVATAQGQRELDAETPEGRTLAQQEADRDAAARERLEQIRRSMGR